VAQELVPLGKLITDREQKRDAFHVACTPAIAGHDLVPGCKVAIHAWRDELDGTKIPVVGEPGTGKKVVGVVDVFLTETVHEGQRFFTMLLPNSVTGMRHAWKSPDFPDELVIREDPEAEARDAVLKMIPGYRKG
jgi:hypothetical protein